MRRGIFRISTSIPREQNNIPGVKVSRRHLEWAIVSFARMYDRNADLCSPSLSNGHFCQQVWFHGDGALQCPSVNQFNSVSLKSLARETSVENRILSTVRYKAYKPMAKRIASSSSCNVGTNTRQKEPIRVNGSQFVIFCCNIFVTAGIHGRIPTSD